MRLADLTLLLALLAGCNAAQPISLGSSDVDRGSPTGQDMGEEPDQARPTQDVGQSDIGRDDAGPTDVGPADVGPLPSITMVFGSPNPFRERADGEDVVLVQGPQGGVHTEHEVLVTGATVSELHLSLIWAEVWRDDLVMARAGWEFWDTQWMPLATGFVSSLPPLVFDDDAPEAGPARLVGTIELVDGREAAFEQDVMLIQQ